VIEVEEADYILGATEFSCVEMILRV